MDHDVVGGLVQRTNRNLMVTNVILLAVLLLTAGVNREYLDCFFHGPYTASFADLTQLKNAQSARHSWITVQGSAAYPTGIERIEQVKDEHSDRIKEETTTGHIFLLVVPNPAAKSHYFKGDLVRLVPVLAVDPNGAPRYTGRVESLEPALSDKLASSLGKDGQAFRAWVLPVLVNTKENFRVPGYWGLAVGVPLALICVWNISKARTRGTEMQAHPSIKALSRYGHPAQVAGEINSEMVSMADNIGSVRLTPHWLLRPDAFGFQAMKIEELVWIYQKVTQHRTNFIPTGKSYAAVLCDRTGKVLEIQLKKQRTEDLLERVGANIPWAIKGYNADVAKLFTKSREELVSQVDARRVALATPVNTDDSTPDV